MLTPSFRTLQAAPLPYSTSNWHSNRSSFSHLHLPSFFTNPSTIKLTTMDYRKLRDHDSSLDDDEVKDVENFPKKVDTRNEGTVPANIKLKGTNADGLEWKRKSLVTIALTILTSSQGILIAWSKRAGHFDYSVTSANCLVELLKCFISLAALLQVWGKDGINNDNNLSTSWEEVKVYPIPAILYMIKNLLQYYIFMFVDAPSYQILKNLNIISTGVLYRLFLKRRLTEIQWAAYVLLALGCTTAQLNPSSDHVLQTPLQGWVIAIVMALLSGFAGVYTEVIIKKRPSRNINVQNFWLYIFGIIFNVGAIFTHDFDELMNKGFFHGYSTITVCMIINHALSGIAVSMVMKFADNIVKVYSTSVAMLLTAAVSIMLFGFQLTLPFVLGSMVVSIAVFLHSHGKSGK